MRKLFSIVCLFLFVLMVGCSSKTNTTTNVTTQQPNNPTVKMDTNHSLAFSTYMASGLLSGLNNTLNLSSYVYKDYRIIPLNEPTTTTETEPTLEIETELDEVNTYFNKLKVFMDNGVDQVLNVTEQESTIEGYDFEMTYSIENVTYTIYYSLVEEPTQDETTDTSNETTTTELTTTDDEEDEEDQEDEKENIEFHLIGLMVINGVNYELTGANEIDGDEQKMWFETIDSTNDGNYVRVEIKSENGEQKFELETVIDGVQTNSEIKFDQEENETKVELKLIQGDQESSYEFKKEIEDGETTYKFEYQIGEVKGEVKIIELTDSEDNATYKYDIEEDGKRKEIEKEEPKDKDDDEDTEEEDSDSETV